MILKYNQYISEKVIYELLLESKVVYSKKFISILNKMKGDKLASQLLNLYSKDIDVQHNYIDITDEKDAVSFTPDRKVKELLNDKVQTWSVTDSDKHLTHSDKNNKIFERLGYDKTAQEIWAPQEETLGTILAETVSTVSGNIYVLFKEYTEENPRLSVMNKNGLEESDAPENLKIWTTSRNPIKIGRLVRAVLNSAKIVFTDKDIEDFTNKYKATYDFAKDALKQFDIVTGKMIAHWYDNENYVDGGGSLNSSCMAEVNSGYFSIYTSNKNVSMVILYSDEGEIKGDKYVSDKIKGRAILWTCKVDNKEAIFMDRVYTRNDSDVELFKQFAEKNGWFYKKDQSMDPDEYITNGTTSGKYKIVVQLDYYDFDEYPYCDTMCYLDEDSQTLCNKERGDRLLRDTSGGYDSV